MRELLFQVNLLDSGKFSVRTRYLICTTSGMHPHRLLRSMRRDIQPSFCGERRCTLWRCTSIPAHRFHCSNEWVLSSNEREGSPLMTARLASPASWRPCPRFPFSVFCAHRSIYSLTVMKRGAAMTGSPAIGHLRPPDAKERFCRSTPSYSFHLRNFAS